MNRLARFNAQIAKTWNAQVWPAMQHQERQNVYLYPRPARVKQPRPAVRTYKTALTTLARPVTPSPEQVEAERQMAIRQTRIANLEKARAVKAANRQSQQSASKETADVNEIATLRAQIAALTAQIERLATPEVAPAPVAPRTVAPKASKPAPKAPAKAKYVATSVALTNHKHGRYSLQMDNTLITLAWNGAERRWDYICGRNKGSAADRGTAVAQINVLLAKAGLPPVRA